MTDLEMLEKNRMTAILRNISKEDAPFVFDVLSDAGVKNIEITLNSPDYKELFEIVNRDYRDKFFLGAGTVITVQDVETAASLGCRYIISPHTEADIIKKTKDMGLVSIPGAFSPSEIVAAHKAGADIIKLFPVMHFPPEYVHAIMQPLNNLKYMVVGIPCGKVNLYKELGVSSFGIGGNFLFPKDLIQVKDRVNLVEHVAAYRKEVFA